MVKNYAEHIVKGSTFIFIVTLIANFIGYLIRIFLARSLTPAEYGLIYACLSILGIANVLRNLGMPETLKKKIPEFLVNNNYVKIKSTMILTFIIEFLYTVAIVSIIFIFSDTIAGSILKNTQGAPILIILCLSTLISVGYQIINSTFQGLHRFKIYTLSDLSTYVLRAAFLVVLIVPFGVLALPYAYMITSAIMTMVVYLVFIKKFPKIIKSKINLDKKISKEILYFSAPMMILYAASTIVNNLDTVLLAFFKTPQDVALYQVALPLANLLLIVSSAITVILLPTVSELWTKKKYDMLGHMIGLVSKALFILMIPLGMIMIAFPENVISLLFGESYVGAAQILQILSFATVIISINSIFSSTFVGIGKPILITKITLIVLVLNIIFNLTLIPLIGIRGAAISLLVSGLVDFVLLSYYLQRYKIFRIQWLNTGKILLDGIISVSIIFVIKTAVVLNPWAELVISLTVSIAFYAIFILWSKSVSMEELNIFRRMNIPIPGFLFVFAKKILSDKR
jgi:O-antigen/teichoic acid export membrane protein